MIPAEVQHKFRDAALPLALEIEKESRIKPVITLTQAAHESNWGQSKLTVLANNLFGFTGESWAELQKPVIYMPTSEYVKGKWIMVKRPFRAYASWLDSMRDWARLMQLPRYAVAVVSARRGDVAQFAKAVLAAGYATDPQYAGKLTDLGEVVERLV